MTDFGESVNSQSQEGTGTFISAIHLLIFSRKLNNIIQGPELSRKNINSEEKRRASIKGRRRKGMESGKVKSMQWAGGGGLNEREGKMGQFDFNIDHCREHMQRRVSS
jgi:hypothetical protein